MKKLTKQELINVKGGSLSNTMLNALSRCVTGLFSIGQAVGSSLRRVWTRNYCL